MTTYASFTLQETSAATAYAKSAPDRTGGDNTNITAFENTVKALTKNNISQSDLSSFKNHTLTNGAPSNIKTTFDTFKATLSTTPQTASTTSTFPKLSSTGLDVKFYTKAANELTREQTKKVEDIVYDYFKTKVFNKTSDLTNDEKVLSMGALCDAMITNATSTNAAGDDSIEADFTYQGNTYNWNYGNLVSLILNDLGSDVINPLRRYGRTRYTELTGTMKDLGIKPNQRLSRGAWGSQIDTGFAVCDFGAPHKANLSEDMTTDFYLCKEQALKRKVQGKSRVHVSQGY